MSGPFLRNDDATVRLTLDGVLGQRPRGRARQHATIQIVETPIVTGTPDDRLRRQECDGASFVCALRAERMQLIASLKNQNALSAHRDDHKLILLEFGCFIARQSRRSRWTSLRQRFQITNNGIGNADQPTEKARTQNKIEKMPSRCGRRGLAHHTRTIMNSLAPQDCAFFRKIQQTR